VTSPRLVFGDDGSPPADVAWAWIAVHPWPGWHIDALTAAEPSFAPPAIGSGGRLEEWEPPWARTLAEGSGAHLRFLTAHADPRVLLGDQQDADLMVVGPRGLGRLEALWVGSTTDWLIQRPPVPLAMIRGGSRVARVVFCADGSLHARRALEAFLALPLAHATRVTVLGVDDGRTDVDAGVAAAMGALEEAGVPSDAAEKQGSPTKVILDHLEEEQPELVVLGTRGLTGWQRLRLGSTAAAVVRGSACSSLVACVDEDEGD